MSAEKKDMWSLEVIKVTNDKVVFEEPVTLDEAITLFMNEEYADVLDSEELYINGVSGGS